MRKIIITGITCVALSMAGTTAASAQVQGPRLSTGAIIAGLAGLGVVGAVLHDKHMDRKRERAEDEREREAAEAEATRQQAHWPGRSYRPAPVVQPGRAQTPTHAPCLRRKIVDGRWVTFRSEGCVERREDRWEDRNPPRAQPRYNPPAKSNHKYKHAKQEDCLRKKWTRTGWVTYTAPSCLKSR